MCPLTVRTVTTTPPVLLSAAEVATNAGLRPATLRVWRHGYALTRRGRGRATFMTWTSSPLKAWVSVPVLDAGGAHWIPGQTAAVWCHDGGLTVVIRVVRRAPQTTMQSLDLRG